MTLAIAATPVFAFADSGSGSGRHVTLILFAGIAIAMVIDLVHEMNRTRRK